MEKIDLFHLIIVACMIVLGNACLAVLTCLELKYLYFY